MLITVINIYYCLKTESVIFITNEPTKTSNLLLPYHWRFTYKSYLGTCLNFL